MSKNTNQKEMEKSESSCCSCFGSDGDSDDEVYSCPPDLKFRKSEDGNKPTAQPNAPPASGATELAEPNKMPPSNIAGEPAEKKETKQETDKKEIKPEEIKSPNNAEEKKPEKVIDGQEKEAVKDGKQKPAAAPDATKNPDQPNNANPPATKVDAAKDGSPAGSGGGDKDKKGDAAPKV